MNSLILFGLCIGLFAQTATERPSTHESKLAASDSNELQPGAVVETVAPDSEAKKANLLEGDLILHWSREKNQGEIQSPFDLSWIEMEEKPRGQVTLSGLRDDKERVWTLGPDKWGIDARPNLNGNLLSAYIRGQALVKASKPNEAQAVWRKADFSSAPITWLSFHAAKLLVDKQQWKDADSVYQAALEQAGNARPMASSQILEAWAQAFEGRSDWANAEDRYQKAITKVRKVSGDNLVVATAINNLGNVAYYRGDLANAEQYHRHALNIRERLAPGSLEVAHSFNNLGLVAWNHGDLAKAEGYYRQALSIKEKLAPNSLDVASSFTNLGLVAWDRGDLAKAEEYYRQDLAITEKLAPGSLDVSTSLDNIGNVAGVRGDLGKAEQYHRQALSIEEKLAPGSLDVAASLDNLGVVAEARGDLGKAEQYYRQALSIYKKLAPGSLNAAEGCKDLGDLFRTQRGDLTQAQSYYRQALEIDTKLAPRSTARAETLAGLATISMMRRQSEIAAQQFQQALEALESQTAQLGGSNEVRSQFRAKHASYYSDYIELLMQQRKPELAFQILERSRAQSLREMLAAAHINIREGIDPGLLERERTLQVKINLKTNKRIEVLTGQHTEEQVKALTREIDGLLGHYDEVEGQIRVSSPSYAALTQPAPLNVREVQERLLDSDTVLVEYSLGKERSYVWVISQRAVFSHELAKSSEIEGTARRVYDLLTARNRDPQQETVDQREARIAKIDGAYAQAAVALSRLVLEPIARDIEEKRLLVVSDGTLQYIPFAALPVVRSVNGRTKQTPLVAEHEIVNLPSASALAVLRRSMRHRQAPKLVAVLADPVFSKDDERVAKRQSTETLRTVSLTTELEKRPLLRSEADLDGRRDGTEYLPRLPFSYLEAQAILSVVRQGQGMEALGFDANRAKATSSELANYRVVHFATHGLLNNAHPELSGLVFSLVDRKGNWQNGFLEMEDIYNLHLPVDLVVLSACETGLGKNIQSEGMVGLTRAFMYAGADRVMASLWNVHDEATSELMKRFYDALLKDGLAPPAALRKAQLQMSQEERWTNPYYWAGFILQGEWRTAW